MAAARERSLVRLGRFVGINLSPKPIPVERERLSLEGLIDLGAFPVADGHAMLFRDSPSLDLGDPNPDTVERISVYFQTIAYIRSEQIVAKRENSQSRSLYELGPLSAVWDEENGSRLGYSVSTWDKDSGTFEYKGFLPLLRLGSIVDQDRTVPPLTHDQLSDALAYLVDSKVLSQKKSQDVLDRHGIASRQYRAALEIESRRDVIKHPHRPLWDVSKLICEYDPNKANSVQEGIKQVLVLAEQVRIYGESVQDGDKKGAPGVSVFIEDEEGTQVAVVSIPILGITQEILRDSYTSDGKVITEPDLDYALKYLVDSGVITLEQKVKIDKSFEPQSRRGLIPLVEDPGEKFRDLVPEYPYHFESDEVGIKRNKKNEVLTLIEQYSLGRFDVYVGRPLVRLNLTLDVIQGKDIVYIFHLGLDGLGDDMKAKHALVRAYFAYANTRSSGQAQRGKTVRVLPRNVPQLYRNGQDNLILAMNYKGSDINPMFTQLDQYEKRIVPQQLDAHVRQIFQQTLQAIVTSVYSKKYLKEDIRITPSIVEHPRGDRFAARIGG